jgi:hypothetical protein
MRCHRCGAEPIGICPFCGRAVCEPCAAPHVFVLTIYVGEAQVPKAIAVSNALWCQTCRPHPEPIPMPELY